jgi:hypothetical protein
MKITSYKEKYERKKYAYTSLLKNYNELVEVFNDTKQIIINSLESLKGHEICDYDKGYNVGVEESIVVVEDIAVPVVYEEPSASFILTRLEYELLKYWDKKYNYIAIDKDGALYTYRDKPSKNEDVWSTEYGHARRQKGFDDLFHFISWRDKEPMNIEELLNNCEVIESD